MGMDEVVVRIAVGTGPHPVVDTVDSEENRGSWSFGVSQLAPEGAPGVEGEGWVFGAEGAELLEGDVGLKRYGETGMFLRKP